MFTTKTAPISTFPTTIDLPENSRQPLIALLNKRLADTADLYSQVKQAHWNVKGPDFYQLHQLFDQLDQPQLHECFDFPYCEDRVGSQ